MWSNPQFSADLVTFTEEILNGKLHFFAVITSNCVVGVVLADLKAFLLCWYDKKITNNTFTVLKSDSPSKKIVLFTSLKDL